MNSKHPKTQQPTDTDLKRNPGIGTSKGTIRDRDAEPDGENTFEGDVENDTTSAGGVDPRQRGRQNK
ncbi:hypothetical protein [Phyllobacterium endophyticum]|uniref:Uncharacterized protein n=1 Tax=Phyllobacterium endophyticum TaxID=1149773 RepID=A0A2P7AM21_9HYPH|nr:hypothetical protein [Phyllobacterium endophyticum]MBB3236237.1 hypothetical protein [Phyllobacterium endophyticum]PSH55251.1 hypothetical protein CU100_24355 [Phyllobacterium endophyticum]TYR39793.1 hypothetical protein FY050_19340 [Phyllobacterium endophyticum]